MSDASADPASIGPFVVLRKLGEGAMGVVYAGYDAQLDRKVALKLVRRQLLKNPAVRERMTREAQAMARLSSPNVVQVYQVGEHDNGIYVAMEYVDGQTLGAWLKAAPRAWPVVLRTLCDAGRGLAAAHAAGLVHRDFKPDNVLVDADGRARVLDFGLVHREGAPSDEELAVTAVGDDASATVPPPESIDRSSPHWSVRLTQMGNVLGTPAYMSPEQHFGNPAGPHSDQFSFCITLYEALYGVRPFNGDSWAAIRLQVQEGVVPPPPLDSPVPRRVFRAIARGLATPPAERWPSMDALIEALEHDPWRARLRVAGMVGLIGAASAASYAVAATQVAGVQRCEIGPEALAGVWDQAREAAAARAFDATHLPFATDTWKRVEARLDGYARAWLDARRAACEAHASGAQTERLADLRIACLDRRKAHLSALVEVFTTADRAVVENAVQAAAALPGPRACDDADSLLTTAPPDDPALVARIEALRERLDRADVLEVTGKYEAGLELAAQVRAEAGPLGYAPLEAEAALSEGRLLMAAVRPAEAEAALLHALRVGIAHDLHAVAGEAATIRIFVVGNDLGRPAEALATAPFAEALVQRARGDARLAALLSNNLGTMHDLGGDVATAQAHFERAIDTLRRSGATDPLEAVVHNNLGQMSLDRGKIEAARGHFVQSLELFTGTLGDGHPLLVAPLNGIGDVDVRRGAYNEAMQSYVRALALVEASHGEEHRYLVYPLTGLGNVYARTGQAAEAAKHYTRALAIADKHGVVDPVVGEALEGLAEQAAAAGSLPQARRLYERAAAAFDVSPGEGDLRGVRAALRAGELAVELGDRDGAIGWFERVLAKKTGASGQDPEFSRAALRLAVALVGRGDAAARACALAGEARDGLPEGDPRRAEAEAVAASACPKG